MYLNQLHFKTKEEVRQEEWWASQHGGGEGLMPTLQYLPFIFALYGQIVNIYYIMSKEVNRQMWV